MRITSRPVAPRARWTASIVDSVPELVNRHCGRPKRRVELLGDDDRAVGGRREVGAEVDPRLDRRADGRVGMADAHHAEAVVEVDVLVAVDVPDLRARAALDVDGPGVVLLEGGRHAARASP